MVKSNMADESILPSESCCKERKDRMRPVGESHWLVGSAEFSEFPSIT